MPKNPYFALTVIWSSGNIKIRLDYKKKVAL